jgi:ADP-heptose:LPS heptosyltransferase
MGLVLTSSVEEFFHEVVTEALQTQRVRAAEPTECYLVALLGEFTKSRITDEPLSLKLVSTDQDPAERVKTLKEVGDTTLYVAGFFAESLESKLIDADYYIGLGEAAYGELGQRLSRGGSSAGELYNELAAKFPCFVDVLAEVRSRVDFAGSDVVKLYEQWMTSRSEWLERRLRSMGMLVDPKAGGKGHIH